ncbi:MAG: AsmA family protein [bacterium]|nr:AsmA family protein [bacterium]
MRRWLLVGVVAVVAVATALGVALARLDDWLEANRTWLTTQVSEALGRPVAYERLSVSMRGGVEVEGVRIGEDAAWGEGDFLRAARVLVRLRFLPLLVGHYRIAEVVLAEPAVTLVRDGTAWNVDSLGHRPPSRVRHETWGVRRVADPAPAAPGRDAIPFPVASLVIGRLTIDDGTVRLVDRRTAPPRELLLRAVALEASPVGLHAPIDVTLRASLLDAAAPNLRLDGTVGPVDNPPAPDTMAVDVTAELAPIELAALRHALPELDAALPPPLVVEGPLSVRLVARGRRPELALEATIVATGARVAHGTFFDKPAGVPLRVETRSRHTDEAVVVEAAAIRGDGLDATAHGTVTTSTPPRLDLQLDTGRTSFERLEGLVPVLRGNDLGGAFELHLRALGPADAARPPALDGTLALYDVRVRPPGAPAGVSGLTTTVRFEGDTATLPPTRVRVGSGTLTASGMVRDLAAPSGAFRIEADAITLADLGLPQEGTRPDVLRDLAVDAQLGGDGVRLVVRAAEATLRDADLRRLTTSVRWQDPIATVESFDAQAFGGTLAGTGTLDLTDRAAPRFAVDGTARGLVLAQLAALRGDDGLADRVEGTVDASAALRGTAGPPKVLRRSLVGTARLDVRDGAVKGVNLLGGVVAGIGGLPVLGDLVSNRFREKRPALLGATNTRFDRLQATARVADGAARTNDLVLTAPEYTVTMAGTIGLAGAVDAEGTLTAGRGLTADVVASIREARFITNDAGLIAVPFHVSGTLPNVTVKPDPSLFVRALRGGLLEEGVGKLLGGGAKAGKGVGKETENLLKKGLNGLLGR